MCRVSCGPERPGTLLLRFFGNPNQQTWEISRTLTGVRLQPRWAVLAIL